MITFDSFVAGILPPEGMPELGNPELGNPEFGMLAFESFNGFAKLAKGCGVGLKVLLSRMLSREFCIFESSDNRLSFGLMRPASS